LLPLLLGGARQLGGRPLLGDTPAQIDRLLGAPLGSRAVRLAPRVRVRVRVKARVRCRVRVRVRVSVTVRVRVRVRVRVTVRVRVRVRVRVGVRVAHQASFSHVILSSASASGRTAYVLLAQSSCSFASGGGATTLLSSTHLHDLDRQGAPSPPQTLPWLLVPSHQSSHDVAHGSTQG